MNKSVPVRGNYQDDMDVVRDFVANKAIDSDATLKKTDQFVDLIRNKHIKNEFKDYLKAVSTPIRLKSEDKILTKHLTNMYNKAHAGEFAKENIKLFAEPEAKALNKGVIHPSLLQKNAKIKELNEQLQTAHKTIESLQAENKQIATTVDTLKKENKSLGSKLNDMVDKYQNLASGVMKKFGTSKDEITEMSNTPAAKKGAEVEVKNGAKRPVKSNLEM